MNTLPPTANTLSSRERSALVRSSRKLTKVLGDVPRVLEESTWNRRKPTHLPPLLPTPGYHRPPPSHRTSAATPSSATSERRVKLERLRRRLGSEVPATAVFPSPSPRAHPRSVTFSISSEESTHTVTFAAARVPHTPPPRKSKHLYQTGPLPPVPPIPAHLASSGSCDDDVGLIRPRQKMAAGSRFGGADFKAARRAKREGRSLGEPGEFIEMVGFLF